MQSPNSFPPPGPAGKFPPGFPGGAPGSVPPGFPGTAPATTNRMALGTILKGIASLRQHILPYLPILAFCLGVSLVVADLNVAVTSLANKALTSLAFAPVREGRGEPSTAQSFQTPLTPPAERTAPKDQSGGKDPSPASSAQRPPSLSAGLVATWLAAPTPVQCGVAIIAFYLCSALLSIMNAKIRAKVNNRMRWRLQEILMDGLDRESGASRRERSMGKSWDALTADASVLGSSVVMTGMSVLQNVIMMVTFSLALLALPGGWVVLLLVVLIGFLGTGFVEWAFLGPVGRLRDAMETRREESNTLGLRFFSALDSLVALQGSRVAGEKVLAKVREQGLATEKLMWVNETKSQLLILLGYLVLPVILFVASAGHLRAGDVLQAYLLAGMVTMSLKSLTATPTMLQQMGPGLERLTRILQIPLPGPQPPEIPGLLAQGSSGLCVEVQGVEFRYPGSDKNILEGVDFKVQPGETVLFVGRPGCGKSTMARLLAFEWKPTAGHLRIGKVEATDWNQFWGRQVVGYLHDKPGWLTGTVLENIAFGDESIGRREVEDLIARTGTRDLIEGIKDGGLDRLMGEPEKILSSGEQKLIGCLRLLVRTAPVLVFDEPDANLAYSWVDRVSRAIQDGRQGRTTFIITHRPQCFEADRVFFFHEGRIIAVGRHEELLATQPEYAKLVTKPPAEAVTESIRVTKGN